MVVVAWTTMALAPTSEVRGGAVLLHVSVQNAEHMQEPTCWWSAGGTGVGVMTRRRALPLARRRRGTEESGGRSARGAPPSCATRRALSYTASVVVCPL